MPRVKIVSPKSLQDLCIDLVAKKMNIWCKHSLSELYHFGPEEGTNPFDCLSSTVLEKIRIKYNHGRYRMKKRVLQHLLTPQLMIVELPADQELLELASVRCTKLEELIIDSVKWAISQPEIFISKFENLQILNIVECEADDSFLHLLGTYCTHLRELYLDGCDSVTDYGVQGLCVSVDSMGFKDEHLGRCKSLQVLSLALLRGVTTKGLKMAIENLPVLEELIHESVVAALAEMALDRKSSNLPELPMSVLRIAFDSPYKTGYLKLALSLCPSVSGILFFEPAGFKDTDLLSLASLKKIDFLEIRWKHVSFNTAVAPALKVIGSSLTSLDFCGDCNIQLIVKFCPNLEHLNLVRAENSDYMVFTREEKEMAIKLKGDSKLPILKNLVLLGLYSQSDIRRRNYEGELPYAYGFSEYVFPPELLVSLLSSPLLEDITIGGCDTLTDDVLLSAAKLHNFKNLEQLYLSGCDSITNIGISIFMQEDNKLEKINFSTCDQVSSESYVDFWKNEVLKKNWDLTINR